VSKGKVNILIDSASVMGLQNRTLTEDCMEAQFAGNYLGFFLLFQHLKEPLLASVTPELTSRFAIVASSAHRAATLPNSDNYNFKNSYYSHKTAYGNAKLAAVYLANTIERLYGARGLQATSLQPGADHVMDDWMPTAPTLVGRQFGSSLHLFLIQLSPSPPLVSTGYDPLLIQSLH
jgi:NAD(P)-dependent dehydrogenase (short-subunit alcohol dehydrogenase family)